VSATIVALGVIVCSTLGLGDTLITAEPDAESAAEQPTASEPTAPLDEAEIGRRLEQASDALRDYSIALISFQIDFSRLPAHVPGSDEPSPAFGVAGHAHVPMFCLQTPHSRQPQTYTLTTPIAYLHTLTEDPFGAPLVGQSPTTSPPLLLPFAYATARDGWILGSRGPDGDWDADFALFRGEGALEDRARFDPFTYDPTNGLASSGDLLAFDHSLTSGAASTMDRP
jgi:hypothetical protein